MRLAQLNTEGTVIDKIYEKEECALYGWTPENMPEFSPEIVLIDITELSPDIREGWSYVDGAFSPPPLPAPPTLAELKKLKIAEIHAAALFEGQQGANIVGSAEPLMSYHMALTPEDVAYFQQANTVAKIEAQLTSIPDWTGEIKEKWADGRTQLHLNVPGAVHDAVLMQAALLCAEITRKQETLIQAAQDAETPEAVGAVSWNAGT